MTRPLRLEFAGALYHVTTRGDRREDIYEKTTRTVRHSSICWIRLVRVITGCAMPTA